MFRANTKINLQTLFDVLGKFGIGCSLVEVYEVLLLEQV